MRSVLFWVRTSLCAYAGIALFLVQTSSNVSFAHRLQALTKEKAYYRSDFLPKQVLLLRLNNDNVHLSFLCMLNSRLVTLVAREKLLAVLFLFAWALHHWMYWLSSKPFLPLFHFFLLHASVLTALFLREDSTRRRARETVFQIH